MKNGSKYLIGLTLGVAVLCSGAIPAQAQFYRGKTLNAVINYAPGGNTSIQGRLMMRYMKKYIPGKPRVVIRNIAGAGGKVGSNYLGEVARRDGTVMGIFTISLIAEVLSDPALRITHADFSLIGGLGSSAIAYVRRDVKPGINKRTDLFSISQPLKSGGHDPSSAKDILIRLGLEMLKVPYKHVYGYKSGGQLRKAVMQDEIQFMSDSTPGFRGRVEPTMVKTGMVLPLYHAGIPTANGGFKSDKNFPDIPNFLQVYRMKFGKNALPEKMYWDAWRLMAGARAKLLRALFLPPGAPKAALADLRMAFNKTMKDPAYLKEFKKLNKALPNVMPGEEGEKFIQSEIKNADPALVKFMVDFVNRARS